MGCSEASVGFCRHHRKGGAVNEPATLEQDLKRQLGRAAAPNQIDRAVEIDVEPRAESLRRGGLVARALQLCDPPALDLRQLAFVEYFSRSHVLWPSFFLYAV